MTEVLGVAPRNARPQDKVSETSRAFQKGLARFGIDRTDEYWVRKADIARISDITARLIAAGKWVIETNGDSPVGRDGRSLSTMGQMIAAHALVDAIAAAESTLSGGQRPSGDGANQ